ncbi:MAG: right-handed parallel beta-helix repeat-containing protein, partial [Anaerolineales bacterium]
MDAGRWQAKLSVLLTIFLGMGPVLIWYVMIGGGAPPAAARRWQPLASLPQDAAPAPNALSVPAPATLALTFDEPVDLTSVTSRAFAVHGSQRPCFKGAYELSNLSRAIFFDPERKFFPGERVDASVTTGTRNITGEHAISPMVGQFWAATKGGSAHFIDSGQSITGTDYGRDSVLGDLDGDGDLDAFGANIGNQDTIRRNSPVATDEVYVSALSGDDNEGQNHCADNAAPCRTVAHAIDMVEASGTVYIAQGVYTENLSIYKPLTLAGGYESAGWTRDIHTYQTILDGSAHQTVRGEWDGSGIQSASVISDGGMYKMWYHGWDLAYDSFGLATSSDGSNWTKSAANPVYTTTDHWGHIAYPFVLKDGATFKLWYAGEGAIYYGESSDGITWDVDTSAPVLEATEGAWDASGLSAPFVLQLGADDYRMWYQAEDKSGIGYATSTDGITWTKHPTPVLAPETGESWDMDGVGDPALWFDGGAYHMWYVNASNWLMGYATSTNGIDWNKYGDNPVFFTGVSGEWDDVNVAAPRVLFDQGEYQMWYAGYGGSDFKWQRGYAVSPDGVTWSKYGDNPVLTADNGGWWGQPVVTLDEGSAGSALEGLTITGGDAQDAGGVYIEVQDVNIRKCHFHHNAADSYQHHDAGAVIRASDTLRVADSIFTQNYTKWAGASAIRAMTLSVTNTLFADNRGDAALHLNGAGRLMNVTIANNDGGMIYNPTMTGTLRITNSVIYHNGYAISDLSTDTTSVAYSDIEGG